MQGTFHYEICRWCHSEQFGMRNQQVEFKFHLSCSHSLLRIYPWESYESILSILSTHSHELNSKANLALQPLLATSLAEGKHWINQLSLRLAPPSCKDRLVIETTASRHSMLRVVALYFSVESAGLEQRCKNYFCLSSENWTIGENYVLHQYCSICLWFLLTASLCFQNFSQQFGLNIYSHLLYKIKTWWVTKKIEQKKTVAQTLILLYVLEH